MNKIVSLALAVAFLALSLVSCRSSELVPTSYYFDDPPTKADKNHGVLELGRENPNKDIEYSLSSNFDPPEDSVFSNTSDFNLIVDILPKPEIVGNYVEDFKFQPQEFDSTYHGIGNLEEIWSIPVGDKLSVVPQIYYWEISFDTPDGENHEFYIEPSTGKFVNQLEFVDIEHPGYELLANNLRYGLFNDHKKDSLEMLDSSGRVRWKLPILDNRISNVEITDANNLLLFDSRNNEILCIDISTGTPKWKLQNKEYNFYQHFSAGDYIWLVYWECFQDDKRIDCAKADIPQLNNKEYIYRFDPETLEILKLSDIPSINAECTHIMNNIMYFLVGGWQPINIETGVPGKIISISDYDLGRLSIPNNFPFCYVNDRILNHEHKYVIHPEKPDNPIEINYRNDFDSPVSISNMMYLVAFYNNQKTNKDIIEIILDFNDSQMFAIDTRTGEKLWRIDRTKLDSNNEIIYIDSWGVLVRDGNKLTCFR